MTRSRAAAFLLAGVVTLEGTSQAAEAIPATIRVDAPASCATTSSVWAALLGRTNRVREARVGEEAASLEITMGTDPSTGTASGELRIVRAGMPSSPRFLTASSCEELTQGMSLVAAVAFDPASSSKMPPAISEEPDTSRVESKREAHDVQFGGGLSFGGSTLTDAVATPAFGAFLDARWKRGFGTLLRLGFTRASGTTSEGPVEADLVWSVGRISICPIRLPLDSQGTFSLMPCAGLDAGVLSAAATHGVTRAFERDRAWVAPSVSGALEILPVRPVFVEARIGAGFPLIRDALAIDPTLELYTAPAVFAGGEVAAGVRFR